MLNLSPMAQTASHSELNQPIPTQQIAVKNGDSKISGKGLQTLNLQRHHQIAIKPVDQPLSGNQLAGGTKGYGVKIWANAGLVVGTTALFYGVVKAWGYFPGWLKSGHNSRNDGTQADRGIARDYRRGTGVFTAVQQDQKRVERHVGRYDDINRGLSLLEQNNSVFEELEVSDVDIPKDARHNEDDILEIDTSEIKQTTHHLRLLHVPVVQNLIPDQEIHIGELFNLPLRNVFSDADGDFLRLSARLATGDSLPNWISISLSPILLDTYHPNPKGVALDVAVSGTTAFAAFVADGGSGLQIIDVSNPSAPTLLGSYD
ncbi:MAG: hypothetical protein WB791_01875, partial [Waddliaceae bacterium]